MSITDTPYTSAYFESHVAGSLHSAHAILPLVLDLVDVRSAVDVGCGVGAWLSVLMELGVDDILGVDGAYVDPKHILIPERCLTAHDLAKNFDVERTFDLAVSLEVAEHLPPERAHTFVETLARLAPVVLFSAAIPGQGGIAHVNERWPDYWAGLFAEHGYVPVDALRHRIWTSPEVEPWYAQNLLLFVAPSALTDSPPLQREYARDDRILNVVHPRLPRPRWRTHADRAPRATAHGHLDALHVRAAVFVTCELPPSHARSPLALETRVANRARLPGRNRLRRLKGD